MTEKYVITMRICKPLLTKLGLLLHAWRSFLNTVPTSQMQVPICVKALTFHQSNLEVVSIPVLSDMSCIDSAIDVLLLKDHNR